VLKLREKIKGLDSCNPKPTLGEQPRPALGLHTREKPLSRYRLQLGGLRKAIFPLYISIDTIFLLSRCKPVAEGFSRCYDWITHVSSSIMPTLVQIKQRAIIRSHRRYVALGHARKLSPLVKPMLLEGLSQHQIAAKLTEQKAPTAADHRQGKRVGRSAWTQMQVSRLLKNMGIIQEKMRWYYKHAHKALQLTNEHYERTGDPDCLDTGYTLKTNPFNGKPTIGPLLKHTRKKPKDYYQKQRENLMADELHKAGLTNEICFQVEDYQDQFYRTDWQVSEFREALIKKEYRKLLRRRSYHRVKARKAKP